MQDALSEGEDKPGFDGLESLRRAPPVTPLVTGFMHAEGDVSWCAAACDAASCTSTFLYCFRAAICVVLHRRRALQE